MSKHGHDLTLDFSNPGLTPDPLCDAYRPRAENDPCLAETQAWDTSELAPLLVAYGLAPFGARHSGRVAELASAYAALGVPKVIAWKAGLRARPKGSPPPTADGLVGRDQLRTPGDRLLFERCGDALSRPTIDIDPRALMAVDRPPLVHVRELLPFVDRSRGPFESGRIASTPDAFARDRKDAFVVLRFRCTHGAEPEMQWHRAIELHGDMLCCRAVRGALVIGEHWAADYHTPGEIRAWAIEVDPLVAAMLRRVAAEAWGLVEALRELAHTAGKDGARHARALWETSRERMSGDRPDETQTLISSAVGEIDGLDELLVRQVG